jgi:DNA repair exonuclease SbcCD ATPase subunit
MAKESGEKFVILHSGVDNWTQGQVIGRDDLKLKLKGEGGLEVLDLHDRLIDLGAIRPASAEEVGQTKVDVSGAPLALSPLAQAELAARDARIEQLRSQVGDLQARVSQAASAPPPVPAPLPPSEAEKAAFERAAKDKDAQIEALLKRVEDLEKKAQEQQKAAAKAGETEKKPSPPPVPAPSRR